MAEVYGNSYIYGYAEIYGVSAVYGKAVISGTVKIYEKAEVFGDACIFGDARIHGTARVCKNTVIENNADVFLKNHVLTIDLGERQNLTFFRDKDNKIFVRYDFFSGKIDKFIEKLVEEYEDTKYTKVFNAAIELAKLYINLEDTEKEEREEIPCDMK